MLKYNVGDVVRFKHQGYDNHILSGRIIETDETFTEVSYLIKCVSCSHIGWYLEKYIIGLDNSYKSVWSSRYGIAISDQPVLKGCPNKKREGIIKKVIFNNPATIVLWNDGTKTVVKAQPIKTVNMTREISHKLDANEVVKFIELKSGQMYTTNYRPEIDSFIIDVYDEFDPEKGLAMAIAKKALGNKGSYYDEFKKWLPKEE